MVRPPYDNVQAPKLPPVNYFLAALIVAVSVACAGCGNNKQPCDANGLVGCIHVEQNVTSVCPPLPNLTSSANFQWVAHNVHPSDTIVPRFLETETVEGKFGTQSPQSQDRWLPAIPTGQTFPLGCRYVAEPIEGAYDVWDYNPDKACVQTDKPCVQDQGTAIPPNPACANCLTQGQCSGPDCINYSFNVAGTQAEAQARNQAAQLSRQLLTTTGLTSFSLSGLLGTGAACPSRGVVTIGSVGGFAESGPTCNQYFPIRSSLGVMVMLPPRLAGNFSQVIGTQATLDFGGDAAPELTWFRNNASIGSEAIAKIAVVVEPSGGGYLIKVVASRHFCIWIHAND